MTPLTDEKPNTSSSFGDIGIGVSVDFDQIQIANYESDVIAKTLFLPILIPSHVGKNKFFKNLSPIRSIFFEKLRVNTTLTFFSFKNKIRSKGAHYKGSRKSPFSPPPYIQTNRVICQQARRTHKKSGISLTNYAAFSQRRPL